MPTHNAELLQDSTPARDERAASATFAREPESQHTLRQSALLHLGPGLLITAFYVLAAPAIRRQGFPPVLALLLAILFVALPVELGELARRGYCTNGRFSLRGIVQYRAPLRWWQYPLIVAAFLILAFFVSGAAGLLDTILANGLVHALPPWFFLNDIGQYAGYGRHALLLTFLVNVVLNGLAAPIVEELYFRGYLLPRLARFGALAPLINAGLFTLYHFWQPYAYVSIFAVIAPLAYLVWWKRNIYLGIAIHCALNLVGNSLLFAAAFGGRHE